MPGYRYRLYSTAGGEVGAYDTLAPNWAVGDRIETADRRRFRIVSILDLDDSDDFPARFMAAFMVEPACAKLPNHGCDEARPGCGGAF